jgi:hypothetical protein
MVLMQPQLDANYRELHAAAFPWQAQPVASAVSYWGSCSFGAEPDACNYA